MQVLARPLKWPPIFPLDKNLVLWLPLSDRSGAVARDRSGKGNNGALDGPTWAACKKAGCLYFDGSNDKVVCSNSASLKPTLSAYSFLFNLVPSTITSQEDLVSFYTDGSRWGYSLTKYGNDLWLRFQNAAGVWTTHNVNYGLVLGAGVQTAIVVTWDGSTWRFYKNGALLESWDNSTITGASTSDFYVGRSGWGWLKGYMSMIYVFTRALTAAEVKRHYEAELRLARF